MQSDCEMQSLGKVLVLVEFSKYFSDLKCQWIFTQTLNVAKKYIYILKKEVKISAWKYILYIANVAKTFHVVHNCCKSFCLFPAEHRCSFTSNHQLSCVCCWWWCSLHSDTWQDCPQAPWKIWLQTFPPWRLPHRKRRQESPLLQTCWNEGLYSCFFSIFCSSLD